MEMDSFLSGLFAAVVVGVIARIIVRGYQPIGCIVTILIGLVGAAVGLWIGNAADWGFWPTFATQIVIGALLVLPFSFGTRDRF